MEPRHPPPDGPRVEFVGRAELRAQRWLLVQHDEEVYRNEEDHPIDE